MRFPVVLFDLDGTLIDSGEIILASFRHATKTVLAREIPDEQLAAFVGSAGLREQMREIDPERAEELVRAYRAHNEPLHRELQACAGVLDLLADLKDEGRRLGIVTAKRRATVQLAFDVLPLEPFFEVVVTVEETTRHKPHPEPILLALERLGADRAEAAYVGDSPFDVLAAKAAGVGAIGATWGRIHSAERLRETEPDALVHDIEELRGVL